VVELDYNCHGEFIMSLKIIIVNIIYIILIHII